MLLDFQAARAYFPKPTRRAVVAVSLGATIGVMGALTGRWHLANTGAAILIAALLYLSYQGVKESALNRLEVERRVIGNPVEGREIRVILRLRNPTPIGFDLLTVVDSPPRLWESQGHASAVTLPPRSTVTLEYTTRPVVGRHSFGPVRISYRDPLGFTRIYIERSIETSVTVSPRLLDRPKRSLIPPRAQLPPGIARLLRLRGQGSLFLELREYTSDDDVRLIDWKASARTGRLMVKIMEREVTSYVVVYLLLTSTMFQGVVGETKAEYAARLAASIADYLARRGDSYAIIVSGPGSSDPRSTSWLRGRGSSVEAMRHIAEALVWPMGASAPQSRMSATRLRRDLMRIYQRRKIMLFLVSDFWEDPSSAWEYARELAKLRSIGVSPLVVTPVTVAFEASRLGPGAPLYRLLMLDRIRGYARMREAFARHGIPSIIAGPRDILESIISRIEASLG